MQPSSPVEFNEARQRIAPDLTDAITAIARRVPDGPVREALTTADPYSPQFDTALSEIPPGTGADFAAADVTMAASAVRFAVAAVRQGDVDSARTWCSRVHDALRGDGMLSQSSLGSAPATAAAALVWVRSDDSIGTGTADQLAHDLDMASLSGGPDVARVYAAKGGVLVEAAWTVVGGHEFGDDDYADASVVVTMPDGTTATGSWRVDGRA